MNQHLRTLVLYGTLTAVVLGAGALAFDAIDSSEASSATTATRVVAAQLGSVSSTVSSTGTVQPATSLDLGFADGGKVTTVHASAGEVVKAGQALAKIDDTQARIDLKTAKANLLGAESKLAAAKEGQPPPGVTPGSGATEVDPAAVAQAEAAVEQARHNVRLAEEALAATTLRAPVGGTIVSLHYAVGDTLSGGGTSATSSSAPTTSGGGTPGGTSVSGSSASSGASSSGTPFATLVDLSTMVVEVGFAEADAGDVAVGQPATVTIDSLAGEEVAGKVASIDTVGTVVSNVVTYYAVIAFDAISEGLKPGMTANVTVTIESRDGVITVPSSAVQSRGGTSTVTVRSGGTDAGRAVEVGLKGAGTTEITSGLEVGEQVVLAVGVVNGGGAPTGGASAGGFPAGGFGGGGFSR